MEPPTSDRPSQPAKTSLDWFIREEEKWEILRKGAWSQPITAFDLCRLPPPPEWYRRDSEDQYRKGFLHGYDEAIQHVDRLRRKGFGRPSEIINIMAVFCETVRRWRREAYRDDVNGSRFSFGFPFFKHDSWWDLKKVAFKRDGGACVRCGSKEKIEAHHIIPVCEGGLPTMENLETLCFVCHRGKPEKADPREEAPNIPAEESQALLIPLFHLTGYPWDWYWGNKPTHGDEGWWQLMPRTAAMEEPFWDWHLDNRRQWFNHKHEAIKAWHCSFARWCQLNEIAPP